MENQSDSSPASSYERVATAKPVWQVSDNWEHHTVSGTRAAALAKSYIALAKSLGLGGSFGLVGLDIGAGAGFISHELEMRGVGMTASEFSEEGCALIRSHNPQIPVVQLDVTNYCEKNRWDLIVARELYSFTRVNAFTDQYAVVKRLVESLTPNGVLLLVASDVTFPHCLDQKLLVRMLRKEKNVKAVKRVLEPVAMRLAALSPKLMAIGKAVEICLAPIIYWKKRSPQRFAAIQVIGVRKKG
jgi:2-polyprenyl-3-methyl-5-hydroxy-6-metoxy-1,4-benzoquinol methylase